MQPHTRSLLVVAFLLAPAAAQAEPRKAAPPALRHASAHLAPPAKRVEASKSIGSPTEGRLLGGAHLAEAPYLRVYPAYSGGDVRWGVDALVGMIDRSARSVRKQFPDAVLSVGHLSKAGGGEIDRHVSHESGRDADVGFYVKNAAGKPILADHLVAFVGDGSAPSWPGAHFDDARNWALVSAMVGDGHAHVTHIFVATPLRQRLLAYAEKIGAPPSLRSRASEVLAQPHGSLPHDDHFHVRIGCPPGMDKCIEQPTARVHARGAHGAVASRGHAGGRASGPAARAPHGAVPPAARAPARPAAPAAPAAPSSKAAPSKGSESATSESIVPSLAPIVPGLDSAVIPAPLTGVRSTWGITKDAPAVPAPPADPIDDADGALDAH